MSFIFLEVVKNSLRWLDEPCVNHHYKISFLSSGEDADTDLETLPFI